jgi:hypothetical protein
MKLLRLTFSALVAASFLTAAALAAEATKPAPAPAAAAAPASPAGIWKWSAGGPDGGQGFELKVQLEHKEGKLTGKMLPAQAGFGDMPETPIADGAFKDGVVSFTISPQFNGQSFKVKFSGKLDGDAIKGTTELPSFDGGEPQKMEWNATRVK